ncbi:MAG: glycosyltransferase family 1 protein [Collimonas sp.]|uniref:glycosyltransferase family 4 protein n=1 Tax=Collimonas sp. TaxID=1963772 RepID=UPI0032670793
MSRLLIECTYVYHHPGVNSGIQRVVRNIVNNLSSVQEEITCIPVIFKDGKILEVTQLEPTHRDTWHGRLQIFLERVAQKLVRMRHFYWLIHARLQPRWPWKASRVMRKLTFEVWNLFCMPLSLAIYLIEQILKVIQESSRAIEIECESDDILVLLDSSWHANFFPIAEQLQRKGISIVSVIYDLIPLTHPQFCDAPLVQVFDRWFEWVANTANGFIAISSTIRDEVQNEVRRRLGNERSDQRWFDCFHLGSELDLVHRDTVIRRKVSKLFTSGRSIYLMVSTIEPRKNHAYLLDAFEKSWADGVDVVLCFVGRIGWKNERLIDRVKKHVELGRRLFMLNDLSDAELEYCYSGAKALVFPSFVEGFGLPLVEAMQRGLPTMASDIPVFHEIGGDYTAYFSLTQSESLSRLVAEFELTDIFPAKKPMTHWTWLSWEDSTRQLVRRVMSHHSICDPTHLQLQSDSHAPDHCTE